MKRLRRKFDQWLVTDAADWNVSPGMVRCIFWLPLAGMVMGIASSKRWRASLRTGLIATALLAAGGLWLPGWNAELLTSGPFLYAPQYLAGSRREGVDLREAVLRRGELLLFREGPQRRDQRRNAESRETRISSRDYRRRNQ